MCICPCINSQTSFCLYWFPLFCIFCVLILVIFSCKFKFILMNLYRFDAVDYETNANSIILENALSPFCCKAPHLFYGWPSRVLQHRVNILYIYIFLLRMMRGVHWYIFYTWEQIFLKFDLSRTKSYYSETCQIEHLPNLKNC